MLRPMHPGVDDPTLRRYFTAEIATDVEAEQLAEALRGQDVVEAAYHKPAAGLP